MGFSYYKYNIDRDAHASSWPESANVLFSLYSCDYGFYELPAKYLSAAEKALSRTGERALIKKRAE
jgi:hypothetical protein